EERLGSLNTVRNSSLLFHLSSVAIPLAMLKHVRRDAQSRDEVNVLELLVRIQALDAGAGHAAAGRPIAQARHRAEIASSGLRTRRRCAVQQPGTTALAGCAGSFGLTRRWIWGVSTSHRASISRRISFARTTALWSSASSLVLPSISKVQSSGYLSKAR